MDRKDPNFMYSYIKLRKSFGKQPMFSETPAVLLDNIEPVKKVQQQYCLRNPVNHESQTFINTSEHYVNTKRITHRDQGVHHIEGGWPKEINYADEEATARHKRRIERDDAYVDTVLNLCPEFVHYIDQNNAIEMYNMYFKGMPPQRPVEKSFIQINNVFKDSENRPISCIAWTMEDEPKLVVSYCDKMYPVRGVMNENYSCFIWNLDMPNSPYADISPPSACWQLACSPTQPQMIIGGLYDGRVCVFDIRAQKDPTVLSAMHLAHRDPVSSLLYAHSRLNNEFFSGSTDGRCMWWDVRNISEPIDALIMSIRIPPGEQISLANAEGVSALQFDRSLPTKFLCGTDIGLVINVNRKGKTYHEIMSAIFQAHNGPVKSVHRSPCTSKVFITCGDWRVNIWSDDIHTSPIISGIGHRHQISDVVWAPRRISGYMSVGYDGKLRYWDLLRRFREPVKTLSISKYPLLKIKPHDEGKLVAVGDTKGTLYLLSLSENLVLSGDGDKSIMMQTLERETRREHILETRVKEIRLKAKAEGVDEGKSVIVEDNYESLLKDTEDEYRQRVSDEINRAGFPSWADTKTHKMRKR